MASKRRDYYDVLGVEKRADAAELKQAYRDLARQFHPDMNSGDSAEDRFKDINEAYAVLSDDRKRSRYDRYGHSAVTGIQSPADTDGFTGVAQAFDDLIGDMLRRRKKSKERGRDLRYTLEVDLVEACLGTEKTISLPKLTSSKTDSANESSRDFLVTIPPGTSDGAIRRIRGEGAKGKSGGAPGDLNVVIRVTEHKLLRREGYDIWAEIPVRITEAALGAIVDVPTLEGAVKMRVPEGTQSGRVLRLRGKGVPRSLSGKRRGDQMVRVVVETPRLSSDEERDVFLKLDESIREEDRHPLQDQYKRSLGELE